MASILERIRQWQHQRAKTAQNQQRKAYLKALRSEQVHLERTKTREKLDEVVKKALEEFRDVAFPSAQVRIYDQGWSLGIWRKKPDNSQVWHSIADIVPRYDRGNQINVLEISGHNQRKTAPVDSNAILQILTQQNFPHKRRTNLGGKT